MDIQEGDNVEGQGRRNEQTDAGFSSALVTGGPTGPVQLGFCVVLHALDGYRGCSRRDYREPDTHDLRLRTRRSTTRLCQRVSGEEVY